MLYHKMCSCKFFFRKSLIRQVKTKTDRSHRNLDNPNIKKTELNNC